ncbi:hypothetical protein [Longimicrobium sp.]|uniref:hypothetical protein n=1 Tax=Longimicrobium sp. TaxID=2029185 RepID=UPI003B3B3A5C
MKDYRTLSVDVLRDFALSQSDVTSLRQVAEEIGISHSALHKFVTGQTDPQRRVKRLIGLWYLDVIETGDDIDVARPYANALDTLLSGVPEVQREATAAGVLAVVELAYTEAGAAPPRWVDALRVFRSRRRKTT